MLPYDPYDDDPDEWGGYVPPPAGVPPIEYTQNDAGWTPPGPDWEYIDGVGWRVIPGSPTAGGGQPQPGGGDRPPKPQDPGDGRVYIWMGDQWGLTQPVDAPVGGDGGGGNYGGYQPPDRGPLPQLNYPQFTAPTFNAPAPFSYGDFSHDPFAYESFTAPTLAEAQNEPGFEYALNQGVKAFENSKAYLGTYKSGATIKGLNDYARNMANQNYNQVFERKGQTYDKNRANAFGIYDTNRANAFGNWDANRANAADTYATNYGVSRDVFDRTYQGAKDEYAPRARASELQFGRDWDQYAYEGDDAYRRWKAMIDANS